MLSIPTAARSHLSSQRREQERALSSVKSQWRRMGADFDASWALIVGSLYGAMAASQRRIAEESFEYVPAVLEDAGATAKVPARERPRADPFVGVTGTGVSVDEALFSAVIVAKVGVRDGATVPQALKLGENRLMQTAHMALADTGRLAERVAFAPRPVVYYTRILTLPSCSRCAVLAGRRYRMETAFERHPNCDCAHGPAEDWDNEQEFVDSYFESLPTAEELDEQYPGMTVKGRRAKGIYSQEDIFTKAGAEAIRNGADINQVVNARRGMYTAADGVKYTREGATRRGWANMQMRRSFGNRSARRRLMPEEIQALAGRNKDEYLRLLRAYGYF